MVHNGDEDVEKHNAFCYGSWKDFEDSRKYLEAEWTVRWRAGELVGVP